MPGLRHWTEQRLPPAQMAQPFAVGELVEVAEQFWGNNREPLKELLVEGEIGTVDYVNHRGHAYVAFANSEQWVKMYNFTNLRVCSLGLSWRDDQLTPGRTAGPPSRVTLTPAGATASLGNHPRPTSAARLTTREQVEHRIHNERRQDERRTAECAAAKELMRTMATKLGGDHLTRLDVLLLKHA